MPRNHADPRPQPPAERPVAASTPGWSERLAAALELDSATPDAPRLTRAARIAAATSGHDDDGPVTAFLAGYAAGLAEGTGQAGFGRAHAASLRAIEILLAAEVAGAGHGTSAAAVPAEPASSAEPTSPVDPLTPAEPTGRTDVDGARP